MSWFSNESLGDRARRHVVNYKKKRAEGIIALKHGLIAGDGEIAKAVIEAADKGQNSVTVDVSQWLKLGTEPLSTDEKHDVMAHVRSVLVEQQNIIVLSDGDDEKMELSWSQPTLTVETVEVDDTTTPTTTTTTATKRPGTPKPLPKKHHQKKHHQKKNESK